MVLNKSNGVVRKYYDFLLEAKILKEEDKVLIDPFEKDFQNNEDLIILQQGDFHWKELRLSQAKYIITPSQFLFNKLTSKIPTFLLPFPIKDIFVKKTLWKDRSENFYYHGRIIPDKLPIEDLKKMLEAGIKITLRGPICKAYWTENDIEEKEFIEYREDIKKLNIEFLPQENDPVKIAEELNKYKYYFTLSTGEAFNVALQEAIACGTIPFVRNNGAYWWAEYLLVNFNTIEQFIEKYSFMKDKDYIEEYSDLISREVYKRYSMESTIKSFETQKKLFFS